MRKTTLAQNLGLAALPLLPSRSAKSAQEAGARSRPCLGHRAISRHLVERKPRGGLHAAREVEECDQRRRLVDPALVPPEGAKVLYVAIVELRGRLGELLCVREQSARLVVELEC